MKNSILLLAVASMFALASCGGEKAAETTTVDTVAVASVDSSAIVADSSTVSDSSAVVDSAVTK